MGNAGSQYDSYDDSYITRNIQYASRINLVPSHSSTQGNVKFCYNHTLPIITMQRGRRMAGDFINDQDFFFYTLFRVLEAYIWTSIRIPREGSKEKTPVAKDSPVLRESPRGSPKGSPRDDRIQRQVSDPRLQRQASVEFKRIMTITPRAETSPRLVKIASQNDLLLDTRTRSIIESRIALRVYDDDTRYKSLLKDEIVMAAKRIVHDMLCCSVEGAMVSMLTYVHELGNGPVPIDVLAIINFRSFDPARMDSVFTDEPEISFPEIKVLYNMQIHMLYFKLAPILHMQLHVREANHLIDLMPEILLRRYDQGRIVLEAILSKIDGVISPLEVDDFALMKYLPSGKGAVSPFVRERVMSLIDKSKDLNEAQKTLKAWIES
jgi:hypothetical protein